MLKFFLLLKGRWVGDSSWNFGPKKKNVAIEVVQPKAFQARALGKLIPTTNFLSIWDAEQLPKSKPLGPWIVVFWPHTNFTPQIVEMNS